MSDSIGLDFGTTNSAVATVTGSHAVLASYETAKGTTDTFPSRGLRKLTIAAPPTFRVFTLCAGVLTRTEWL